MTQCRRQPILGTASFNVACPNLLGPFNIMSCKLVKSFETDQENSYENRSPVFSHERCPSLAYIVKKSAALVLTIL